MSVITSPAKIKRKYNPAFLQQFLRQLEDEENPPLCARFCEKFGTPACLCFTAEALPEIGHCPGFIIKASSESEFLVLLKQGAQTVA